MNRGYFITLEGIEGAGKSTAMRFITEYLQARGIPLVVTREPGGTEIAEQIRPILLNHHYEPMHRDTELLLYFAGRAQHLAQIIKPALENNQWVICDRFTDTTYAYQGVGRGIPAERIAVLEQWVQGDLRPDYTILLDVDVDRGMKRIRKSRVLDRFEVEKAEFFQRIRECYLNMAKQYPERYRIIDANQPQARVIEQIIAVLANLIAT